MLSSLRAQEWSGAEDGMADAAVSVEQLQVELRQLRALVEHQGLELAEAHEQQIATSDVLRVIASSASNLQAALDTIAHTAMQLVGGTRVSLLLRERDHLVLRVSSTRHGEPLQAVGTTLPLTARIDVCAAVLEHRTIHHPDRSDSAVLDEFPDTQIRDPVANVTVPLLRERVAIGAMSVARDAAHAYTDREIALVEMFANQAVIAIENARLFEELERRNRDLSEALEQQTATAEVLRVIAASPTDLERVLDALAHSVARLCQVPTVVIWQVTEDVLRWTARTATSESA